LKALNEGLHNVIERQTDNITIGMEVALCRIRIENIDYSKVELIYSGAKRPLWLVKENEELFEIKDDNEGIGFAGIKEKHYKEHTLFLPKNTLLYLTSDGYIDQANPEKKRIGSTELKKVLQEIAVLPLAHQKKALQEKLNQHQRSATQRDDITLLGVKI
jgi:serine phosphatase RsbU (regulator of sigma subunit)